jgi:hypothetical protein
MPRIGVEWTAFRVGIWLLQLKMGLVFRPSGQIREYTSNYCMTASSSLFCAVELPRSCSVCLLLIREEYTLYVQ